MNRINYTVDEIMHLDISIGNLRIFVKNVNIIEKYLETNAKNIYDMSLYKIDDVYNSAIYDGFVLKQIHEKNITYTNLISNDEFMCIDSGTIHGVKFIKMEHPFYRPHFFVTRGSFIKMAEMEIVPLKRAIKMLYTNPSIDEEKYLIDLAMNKKVEWDDIIPYINVKYLEENGVHIGLSNMNF